MGGVLWRPWQEWGRAERGQERAMIRDAATVDSRAQTYRGPQKTPDHTAQGHGHWVFIPQLPAGLWLRVAPRGLSSPGVPTFPGHSQACPHRENHSRKPLGEWAQLPPHLLRLRPSFVSQGRGARKCLCLEEPPILIESGAPWREGLPLPQAPGLRGCPGAPG